VLAGAWVWYAPNLLWFCALPGVYLLRMALNAIDGLMAKEHGQASRLGAFWNELADLLGDAALYAAFVRLAEVWLVVLLILLGWLSEVAGILGWAIDGKRRNDGPMGKSDRALWLGLAAGLTGLGARSGARWVLIGVIVLCTVTIYNRMQRRSL
jgi:CDP-diacylglycerol--glycerol-3-phosphate 3-phosphatidyltransferase